MTAVSNSNLRLSTLLPGLLPDAENAPSTSPDGFARPDRSFGCNHVSEAFAPRNIRYPNRIGGNAT